MSEATRDPEFDAITEKEIFEEARDRLQTCLDAEGKNRTSAKLDMRFREGDQWDHSVVTTASEERPELTINLTDALVRRVVNNIKEQRPRGKCHPVGDGATVEVAGVINGLGRHVEVRSEASVAYDTAADCAVDGGFGYFRLIAEYVDPKSFQKDLRILPILDVFTVYMDPSAIMPSGADMNWCEISTKMKRTEYRRRYPRAANVSWTDLGRDDSNQDWEDKEEIRLAEYFRIREKAEKLYGLRNIQTQQEVTYFESELPQTIAPEWQIEGERESSRRAVEWFRLNGLKVVERAQLPGQWIPVFRVCGNQKAIDGQIVRRGMVRFMADPQRMVNYGEVAKIRRLGLTPQSPWIAAEGQLDGHPEWTDANRSAFPVLIYKPVTIMTAQGEVPLPPPARQPPAGIEQGFSEFVQGMRTNLMAVAGMPNEPGADTQGEVVSGVAMQRRQSFSDQSHVQYYDNTTLAIAQLWRVMLEWFPAYYHEPGRIQRMIGDDSQPQMVELNKTVQEGGVSKVLNDLSVGSYDVVMDTGPGYETKREEGASNLIELLKIPPLAEIISKVAPDLVFRSIDHPYMQEIADRLVAQTPEGLKKIMDELPERARDIVTALSNENAALKQALQTAQQDLKLGITKAHLDATVKAHGIEEDNKTRRLDTATRAATAREDRELEAGVQVFVEGMKHGHESNMAEREAQRLVELGTQGEASGTNGS